MDRIFNADNGFFRALSKIIDCIAVNFCWLMCNIPTLFIIYLCIAAKNFILLPLVIVFMVLSGPATSGMYYVIVKNIRNNHGYCWQEFWNGFKNSFKVAFLAGMAFSAFLLLMVFDFYAVYAYVYNNHIGPFCWVFVIMALVCIMWGTYLFAYIARFNDSAKVAIKNTIIIALGNLPKSLVQLLIFLIFAFAFYLLWPLSFVGAFFLPVLLTLFESYLIEKTFRKYMSEEDIQAEDERNREFKN